MLALAVLAMLLAVLAVLAGRVVLIQVAGGTSQQEGLRPREAGPVDPRMGDVTPTSPSRAPPHHSPSAQAPARPVGVRGSLTGGMYGMV